MKQFIKFGLIGICNSCVNYIIYAACIRVDMHYVTANIIGFIVTVGFAYVLQKYLVFYKEAQKGKQVWWKMLIKTYVSYAFTGLVLTNVLSVLWMEVIGFEVILEPFYRLTRRWFYWKDAYTFAEYIVPFVNAVLIMPVNFILNKYWTYNQPDGKTRRGLKEN